MPDWSLRPALPSDAQGLSRAAEAAYAMARSRLPDLPDVTSGFAEEIADKTVWVAVMDGRIIGGMVLDLGDVAKLANVFVDPGAGTRGAGKALIALAEELAGRAGYNEIALATHVKLPGNIALYEYLGWRLSGQSGQRVHMKKLL